MEDRELIKKLLAKDEEAYGYFYRTYRPRIYKACVYLLGYRDPDAEDVTQEVFLAALKQLPQFEFRSSLYHWLHCICTYLCYQRIRKRKRQIVSLEMELEGLSASFAVDQHRKNREADTRSQMLQLLETQKALMGDPCKSLLDLRDKEGKSYVELSEILKVPMGTINSRLARCKEALKDLVLKALGEVTHGG